MSNGSLDKTKQIPASATRELGYEEAENMLRDLLSPDLISGTAIRVARDHMVQFGRRLPAMISAPENADAKACNAPLGDSGITCALTDGHDNKCAAVASGNSDRGWLGLPPFPHEALMGPLDDDQFAMLLAILDVRIKAQTTDTIEMAYLLTLKLELTRLRVDNDLLHGKLSKSGGGVETAAVAIAMNRFRNHSPPVRWPDSPTDRIQDRDGTVPITWEAAEQFRQDAAAALGAAPANAIINELSSCLQDAIQLLDDCEISHPGRWEAALAKVGQSRLVRSNSPEGAD